MENDFFKGDNRIRSWFVGRMEDAFIAADDSHVFLDANEHAKMLFPKLNGLEPADFLPEDLWPLFSDKEDRIRLKNRYYEKRLIKAGDMRSITCLILTDRTEQEAVIRELEKIREDKENIGMTKSLFLSNVSHEIRTPMNAIVGMSDLLLKENVSPKVRGYLDNIKVSADNLLYIVNELFDISRIEDGSLKIVEEAYEPMSLFNDLSMMFIHNIGDKPVELLYTIDPGMPSRLHGDVKRIRQIIINIVNNAIQYTDSGFISVSVTVEERYDDDCTLSFSISDSGRGIKDEDKGALFYPFRRPDRESEDEKDAPGLGLSVCRQLVKLMGGEIGVESTFGAGSRFYFRISQGIVDDRNAAVIKEKDKKVRVWSLVENSWLKESLYKLCGQYSVDVEDYRREMAEYVEKDKEHIFLFTDSIGLMEPYEEKSLSDSGVRICVLRNPVSGDPVDEKGRILINKPLYSLNFCQVLNGAASYVKGGEGEPDFTAPEARILIVDDNEMNIRVARELLSPLKMHIDSAENGKAGVECVLGNNYDLIFMDHMMPVMDGVKALERIREINDGRYAEIPVIALSANATDEAEELFREKGFSDFVAKPIRVRELIKCVKKWLPEKKIVENAAGEGSGQEDLYRKNETEDTARAFEDGIPETIEGINVEDGISYCGSPALFLKCLVIFYKIIDKKTKVITKCLEDDLVRDLTIEVHALKNSARMIGAGKLSEDFRELERMGNEEDLAGLKEKTPEVLKLYQSYKAVLKPFSEKDNKNASIPDREKFINELELIKKAIDEFDMDGADEAMGKIRDYPLPGDLNDGIMELDALVSDFAMEDVVALADDLIIRAKAIEDWSL